MAPLPSDLRSQLEKTVITARDQSEAAARATLTTLAVERTEAFTTMSEAQRRLRRALRAKARQLGEGEMTAGIPLLIHEIAYEQWHRMLFARFLAETGLLMHPDGVAVTLQDCTELAPEEGAADGWELAARYAGQMLPGIFLADDPAVQVRFAPEHRHALERLVQGLPTPVFTADDSLGWVYQFWQSKKKDEVNASGDKINSTTIGPVTQLFTEDYMVKFLLHNSLGAWWAARHPESPLIGELTYLRWLDEADQETRDTRQETGDKETGVIILSPSHQSRTPAAGTFPGWPTRVAEVTMMDPSGGSGHFVVAGFDLLVQMRMEEEGLDMEAAVRAVIRDNLFMLDIDPRCCQLATFNLLLTAWKRIGYRADLPVPNIACSGIAVEGQLADWLALAGDDVRLQTALKRLYELFKEAPTLGSLINPADASIQADLFIANYAEVAPLLERALQQEKRTDDPVAAVLGETTRGVFTAFSLLGQRYTLVATNVPYLGFKKQSDLLKDYCENQFPDGKMNLAAVFVERCIGFTKNKGSCALVTAQDWLFLGSYAPLRKKLLQKQCWNLLCWLGSGAFATISGEVVKPILLSLDNTIPSNDHTMYGLDISDISEMQMKAQHVQLGKLSSIAQALQLKNPDYRISLNVSKVLDLLQNYAFSPRGIVSGDTFYWIRYFWELPMPFMKWRYLQSTVQETRSYHGRDSIINWQTEGKGMLRPGIENPSYGQKGVVVSQMGSLPCTLYSGELYDNNCSAVVPQSSVNLPAIWMYCQSKEFQEAVRSIDRKMNVTNATLVKVPFDLDYWQKVAEEQYPDGLPEPYSNDPTQWLFNGHPAGATDPLQVAVARLLGYRWPQNGDDALSTFADSDGIVCLPAAAGEQPAHDRLRVLLAHAYSHPPQLPDFERYRVGDFVPTTPVDPADGWSAATQASLLAAVGYGGKGLDEWLRDGFFEQHCKLFQNRPFIWHIWDGRKDGFSALVNYHKLDAATLDKLIYTYLGHWISAQRAAVERGEAGADGRLVAALELQKKLELIRNGEDPYDLYIRWKALHQQPIGWQPDLNDGVRLNCRPWVEAGVFRKKFTINWNTDRGKNPDGSDRVNDRHFSRAEKEAARQQFIKLI